MAETRRCRRCGKIINERRSYCVACDGSTPDVSPLFTPVIEMPMIDIPTPSYDPPQTFPDPVPPDFGGGMSGGAGADGTW